MGKAARALALALVTLAAVAGGASRAEPPASASARAGTTVTKAGAPAAKLPATTKIKDCCGYPISAPGAFLLTFYWIAQQERHAWQKPDTDLYDSHGLYIGTFSQAFVEELRMEGTGVLMDGRLLNWAGKCKIGSGACFLVLDPSTYPDGRGVHARSLQIYRSIAVDPRIISIGDAVYIPELVGVVLPDGTVHDGCVRADDEGLAIKKHHIDFFVGSYDEWKAVAPQLAGRDVATPTVAEPRCRYLVDAAPHTVF